MTHKVMRSSFYLRFTDDNFLYKKVSQNKVLEIPSFRS